VNFNWRSAHYAIRIPYGIVKKASARDRQCGVSFIGRRKALSPHETGDAGMAGFRAAFSAWIAANAALVAIVGIATQAVAISLARRIGFERGIERRRRRGNLGGGRGTRASMVVVVTMVVMRGRCGRVGGSRDGRGRGGEAERHGESDGRFHGTLLLMAASGHE
jgi:hypothetical protein